MNKKTSWVKVASTTALALALLSPIKTFAATLTDIDQSYAKNAIIYLQTKNVVSGTPVGTFLPKDTVTREQFAKMLVEAKGFHAQTDEKAYFTDNQNDKQWYFGYIQSAKKNGLMNGLGTDRFGVGQTLTREEMVIAIINAMGLSNEVKNDVPTYTDAAKISSWASAYVGYAEKNKLIAGMADGSFQPKSKVTREMAAQIIYNMLTKEAQNETTTQPATDNTASNTGSDTQATDGTTTQTNTSSDSQATDSTTTQTNTDPDTAASTDTTTPSSTTSDAPATTDITQ